MNPLIVAVVIGLGVWAAGLFGNQVTWRGEKRSV